jgi:hypothetical protein
MKTGHISYMAGSSKRPENADGGLFQHPAGVLMNGSSFMREGRNYPKVLETLSDLVEYSDLLQGCE